MISSVYFWKEKMNKNILVTILVLVVIIVLLLDMASSTTRSRFVLSLTIHRRRGHFPFPGICRSLLITFIAKFMGRKYPIFARLSWMDAGRSDSWASQWRLACVSSMMPVKDADITLKPLSGVCLLCRLMSIISMAAVV